MPSAKPLNIIFLVLLSIGILLSSCSNEFEVIELGDPETVVYGLLNPDDSVHYIRILKAFGVEGQSAFVLAKDPSLLYWGNELSAELEHWSGDTMLESKLLTMEDLSVSGIEKEDGLFASHPNMVLSLKYDLFADAEYRLKIENSETGRTHYARTETLGPMESLWPTDGVEMAFFDPEVDQGLLFKGVRNARVYDVWLNFRILERENSSSPWDTLNIRKQLVDAFKVETTDGKHNIDVLFYNRQFYAALAGKLSPSSPETRRFLDFNLEFWAGNEDLYQYLLDGRSDQFIADFSSISTYSNVEGAYGIFAARRQAIVGPLFIDDRSMDSLTCGSLTHNLGFELRSDHPFFPVCD